MNSLLSYAPVIAIIVALLTFAYQIEAKRKDDLLASQLERLNNQITNFYGPLLALFETDHQNYLSFLLLYGDDFYYTNKPYRQWAKLVFQPTNTSMEDIIINRSDLILGNIMPDFFIKFCLHVDTLRVYIEAWQERDFKDEQWQIILRRNSHPSTRMRSYIKATFEVLKNEQSRLLSNRKWFSFLKEYVDEKKLMLQIHTLVLDYTIQMDFELQKAISKNKIVIQSFSNRKNIYKRVWHFLFRL